MVQTNSTGLGVDFNLNLEDGFVEERGEEIIHETAITCPSCNQAGVNGSAISDFIYCDKCEGTGLVWRNPIRIKAIITGIRQFFQLVEQGIALPGDAVMSVSPLLNLTVSQFDRISFTIPQVVSQGQVIQRGIRENKYQTGLEDNEDRLFYEGVETVYCEDVNGIEYKEGSDFYLKGRTIVWLKDLTKGTKYTIKYKGLLEWIAFYPPDERRDVGVSLGPRVLLRKRHVANLLRKDLSKTLSEKESLSGVLTV